SLAVSDTGFIDPEGAVTLHLGQSAEHQTTGISGSFRSFHRITAQPAGYEDYGQLSLRFMRPGDDSPKLLAVRRHHRFVYHVDIRISFGRLPWIPRQLLAEHLGCND